MAKPQRLVKMACKHRPHTSAAKYDTLIKYTKGAQSQSCQDTVSGVGSLGVGSHGSPVLACGPSLSHTPCIMWGTMAVFPHSEEVRLLSPCAEPGATTPSGIAAGPTIFLGFQGLAHWPTNPKP